MLLTGLYRVTCENWQRTRRRRSPILFTIPSSAEFIIKRGVSRRGLWKWSCYWLFQTPFPMRQRSGPSGVLLYILCAKRFRINAPWFWFIVFNEPLYLIYVVWRDHFWTKYSYIRYPHLGFQIYDSPIATRCYAVILISLGNHTFFDNVKKFFLLFGNNLLARTEICIWNKHQFNKCSEK